MHNLTQRPDGSGPRYEQLDDDVIRPTTPLRALGRVVIECALGGIFFGGLFGAVVGVVFAVVAAGDLGTEGLTSLAGGMLIGAPTFGVFGCIVGIVFGLGYGLAIGVGTGVVMTTLTSNDRSKLVVGQIRLVAAVAAASSALLGISAFLLLNGGGRTSFADELPLFLTVLMVFVVLPGAIAAGFAAWRSPGWTTYVEDAAGLQPR